VIRVDLRGHGDSPRADGYALSDVVNDVHALVETLAPGEIPWVVGHSMGGVVASAYAGVFPTRGVVNIDQPLEVQGLSINLKASEETLRGEGFQQFMEGMFASMVGELDPATVASLAAARSIEKDVVLGNWAPLIELDPEQLDAWVSTVIAIPESTPYLSFHGLDVGPAYAEWLRARIPQAQVETGPVSTHYPHLADPVGFMERLTRFTAS
jgi:pimeloyl-ACP methyl ester carboxylesterase